MDQDLGTCVCIQRELGRMHSGLAMKHETRNLGVRGVQHMYDVFGVKPSGLMCGHEDHWMMVV